jgi:hypothetical protein
MILFLKIAFVVLTLGSFLGLIWYMAPKGIDLCFPGTLTQGRCFQALYLLHFFSRL